MNASTGTTSFRKLLIAITIVAGSAIAGTVAAPSLARADDGQKSCSSATACDVGSHDCCSPGDSGSGTICSTLCPIIIK